MRPSYLATLGTRTQGRIFFFSRCPFRPLCTSHSPAPSWRFRPAYCVSCCVTRDPASLSRPAPGSRLPILAHLSFSPLPSPPPSQMSSSHLAAVAHSEQPLRDDDSELLLAPAPAAPPADPANSPDARVLLPLLPPRGFARTSTEPADDRSFSPSALFRRANVPEGYGFRPLSNPPTPLQRPVDSLRQSPLPDPNGLGWPGT